MTTELKIVGPNNLGALYSFLRVLATNVGTALLPLFLSSGANASEYPAGKALVIAVVVSALLTVVNYVRPGNVAFGNTAPNVVREGEGELGRGTLGLIGLILAVVGAIVLLLILLNVIVASTTLAVLVLIIGVVLLVVDGNGTRV